MGMLSMKVECLIINSKALVCTLVRTLNMKVIKSKVEMKVMPNNIQETDC